MLNRCHLLTLFMYGMSNEEDWNTFPVVLAGGSNNSKIIFGGTFFLEWILLTWKHIPFYYFLVVRYRISLKTETILGTFT